MKQLRAIREARGLTQRQCYEALGVEEYTWRRWEQRRNLPRDEEMPGNIADFLGVTLDQLAGRAPFEPQQQAV